MKHSCLYYGTVQHSRTHPVHHKFRYQMWSLFLDLDEMVCVNRGLHLLKINRPSLFSINTRDYGDGSEALKAFIINRVYKGGIKTQINRVCLLTYPKLLGYVFNPVNLYYCFDTTDEIVAVVYEVNNTFGERHYYVLPVEAMCNTPNKIEKNFYVSPFMATNGAYKFSINQPSTTIKIGMEIKDKDENTMAASFVAKRYRLADKILLKAALTSPFMTYKVILGIHFEALRLWFKGLKIYPHSKNIL